MMKIYKIFILLLLVPFLKSCLVPPAPHRHYFAPVNIGNVQRPQLTIFSIPRYKYYEVINTNANEKIFIKAKIFDNPNAFYLMENKDSFSGADKRFIFKSWDRKFYKNDLFENVTIKIVGENNYEEIIAYKLVKNQ